MELNLVDPKDDPDSIEPGWWVCDVPPWDDGKVEFLLFPIFRSDITRTAKEAKRLANLNGVKGDRQQLQDDLYIELLADHAVRDWRGITYQGQPVTIDKKTKSLLFQNVKVANRIVDVAQERGNVFVEKETKN